MADLIPSDQVRQRPLDLDKCSRGWRNQREHSYWIPDADIEGEIPKELYGTLFRNGPGLNEVYGTKLKHPIDGDGMVCAITFQNGHAHFKSKFVSTKHRQEENKKRRFLYRGQMGTMPTGAVSGTFTLLGNLMKGTLPQIQFRNPSNTNSFYWGGKLLTCYETSMPYCLDPYTLETLGQDDLCGALKLKALAAHFRIDAENQRLVCISFRPGFSQTKSSLAIYEFTPSWQLHQRQLHHITNLNYAHDFLLLEDYYIFHITPFAKSTWPMTLKILAGWTSPGEEMRYYPDMPSRFVIIPREMGKDKEVMMMDTDPCLIFHFGTAQNEGNCITFTAVCLDTNMNMTFDHKIWLSNASVSPGRAYNFHIDLTTKKCTRVLADRASVEFPNVHPYRHGMLGTRYNYLMANDRPGENIPFRDIVKFDAKSSRTRQVWFSHGVIGEPIFVPRLGYESWKTGDEDDGYLIVQLYVPERDVTEFCILDAKDLGKGPLARLKLKHHIPYGFHGTFTPEVFLTSPIVKSKL